MWSVHVGVSSHAAAPYVARPSVIPSHLSSCQPCPQPVLHSITRHTPPRPARNVGWQIRGLEASVLLAKLSTRLAASAGAACHSGEAEVSSVLCAMAVPREFAIGTLRLSTGRHTTLEEVDRAAEIIVAEVQRQWQSAEGGLRRQ